MPGLPYDGAMPGEGGGAAAIADREDAGRSFALGALTSLAALLLLAELVCRSLLATGGLYRLVDASGSLTSVADIMREAGIRGKARRRWKATTNSKHREPVSPNLVPQGTCAIASNLIWVTDTTFIRTAEGWLYLCVFVDLYSRKVVGWATSSRNDKELVISAFWSALKSRRPGDGLIIHSDQGSTFASRRFRALLSASKCSQSMSRRGNCFDNAVCESFFHSLKVELDGDKQYVSRVAARERLFDYIEGFYNRVRLHSALAYRSPEEFELTARSA